MLLCGHAVPIASTMEAPMHRTIAALLAICAAACVAGQTPQPAQVFKDRTSELGLSISTDAACWVDVDNDGWSDLITGGAVWRNNAGKAFTKLADMGTAVAADFDNDGFVDLFSWTQLRLYRSEGGKSFREFALPPLPTVCRGACWGDWNNDGFADLFVGGYEGTRASRTPASCC